MGFSSVLVFNHLVVVPPVEEDPHHQEGWILIRPESDKIRHLDMARNKRYLPSPYNTFYSQSKVPGVPEQVHPLRVKLSEEVRGWRVLHWDPHAVQGRHPLLLASLHL